MLTVTQWLYSVDTAVPQESLKHAQTSLYTLEDLAFMFLAHVFTLQCKSIHDCAHSPAAHLPPLFRSCATLTNSHNSEALSLDELE